MCLWTPALDDNFNANCLQNAIELSRIYNSTQAGQQLNGKLVVLIGIYETQTHDEE